MSDKLIGLGQNQIVVHGHLSSGAYTDVGTAATADAEDFVTKVAVKAKEKLDNSKTLDLNFTRGMYSKDDGEYLQTTSATELLTVERSTPKWVFGPNGKLREVPPNTLARQWNPETGEPEGVLIEEQRTNKLLYSDKASPTSLQMSTASDYIGTAPDGLQKTMTKITVDSDAATNTTFHVRFGRSTGGDPAVSHSGSVWIKSLQGSVTLQCDCNDGESVPITVNENWKRISAVSPPVGNRDFQFFDIRFDDGQGGKEVVLFGAQVEEGSTPSSYIKTEDAQVTRAADNVSRELGEEFNPSEFTLYAEFLGFGDHRLPVIGLYEDLSELRYRGVGIQHRYTDDTVEFLVTAEGANPIVAVVKTAAMSKIRVAMSVAKGSLYYAANGVGGVIALTQENSTVQKNFLRFAGPLLTGTGSSKVVNVSISFSGVFPRALSDAELITLTTLE